VASAAGGDARGFARASSSNQFIRKRRFLELQYIDPEFSNKKYTARAAGRKIAPGFWCGSRKSVLAIAPARVVG
jgi:hypothetical protein